MRKQKFLRKQKPFTKARMVTYIVFLAGVSVTLLMVMFFENYTLQSPIILRSPVKSRFISPIGKIKATEMVRRDTIEDFTVSPTPTIAPRPTVMPKKAPVKRSLVPVAEASESYPYEDKIGRMDEGQIAVMRQVEGTLGKAYAELIFREAGFHPLSVNSSSGACGLAQALPCSKMACELTDVDCQLNWIKSYVERRYTNIENALLHHDKMNWY